MWTLVGAGLDATVMWPKINPDLDRFYIYSLLSLSDQLFVDFVPISYPSRNPSYILHIAMAEKRKAAGTSDKRKRKYLPVSETFPSRLTIPLMYGTFAGWNATLEQAYYWWTWNLGNMCERKGKANSRRADGRVRICAQNLISISSSQCFKWSWYWCNKSRNLVSFRAMAYCQCQWRHGGRRRKGLWRRRRRHEHRGSDC